MNATSIASPNRDRAGVWGGAPARLRKVKILLRDEGPLSRPASKERLAAEPFVQRSHAHVLQFDDVADQWMQRRVGADGVARLKAGGSGVAAGLGEHRVQDDLGDARIAA